MIRALFLHRDISCTSGVTRCILTFAENARPEEVQVRLACFIPPADSTSDDLEQRGLSWTCIGDGSYFTSAFRLRSDIRTHQIDVIVACSFKSYLCAKLAAMGTRCAVVCWVHGVQKTIEGRIRQLLFARVSRSDTLLYVSEFVRNGKRPAYHAGPAVVVYNGVGDSADDPAHAPYARSQRSELGIAESAFVIGYVAELVPWKDHETLIGAFERLADGPDAVSDVHLLLVGTGLLEDEIRQRAQRSPLCDRIHLLGARPDARRLLGLVDVCVHPAREEGFGLVVVEAILAERPVIVARSGAMPEYVEHGVTGRIFEPGNVAELAEALRWVHDHPTQAHAIAREARNRCRERFSPRQFAAQITEAITFAADSVQTGRSAAMNRRAPSPRQHRLKHAGAGTS